MTSAALNPLRKQGNVSRIHAAPLAMLLQGSRHSSDGHVGTSTGIKALPRRPRYYLYRAQGAPPTTTLLSVQGSGHFPTSHVSSKLHPHCRAGHLLVSIKGGVQGPTGRGGKKEGGGTGKRERHERAPYERTDARRGRAKAGRVGETWWRQPQTARLKAISSPSLSLSLVLALPQRL
jgi:hypothetical protein